MKILFSKNIKLSLLLIALFAGVNIIYQEVSAQKKSRAKDFSHSEKAHKKSCNSCHKLPSSNWKSAGIYPNISDYPNHESCVSCHREEFFRGNRPAICATCHIEVSPRGKARLRFPVRQRSQEFTTIFPHSVHQDIIAKNELKRSDTEALFVRAKFDLMKADDEKKPQFNGCTICHSTAANLPAYSFRLPLVTAPLANPNADTFKPTADFFKNSPNSHESCFNCHYQGQKPIATDCASCHLLTRSHFESNVITRYSLKFKHEDKNHNNKDCSTCHIRITQSADLRSLTGADVPILTCNSSACHGDKLKLEITTRNDSVAKKETIFQCNYCHTAQIGSYEIPKSHNSSK